MQKFKTPPKLRAIKDPMPFSIFLLAYNIPGAMSLASGLPTTLASSNTWANAAISAHSAIPFGVYLGGGVPFFGFSAQDHRKPCSSSPFGVTGFHFAVVFVVE